MISPAMLNTVIDEIAIYLAATDKQKKEYIKKRNIVISHTDPYLKDMVVFIKQKIDHLKVSIYGRYKIGLV